MKQSEIDAAGKAHVLSECPGINPDDFLVDVSKHDFEAGAKWALKKVVEKLGRERWVNALDYEQLLRVCRVEENR